MSNLLLEGAACGRPLLASNIHGCKEIIIESENGFLFEPNSTQSIIIALNSFSELSREERVKMGLKSRDTVVENFNRNIVVKKYLEAIGGN